MRQLASAQTLEEAHLYKHLLDSADIPCTIEDASLISGSLFTNIGSSYIISVPENKFTEAQGIINTDAIIAELDGNPKDGQNGEQSQPPDEAKYGLTLGQDAKVFRALVATDLAINILFWIQPYLYEEKHPEQVLDYLDSLSASPYVSYQLSTFGGIMMLITVSGLLGLFFFKEWAKYAYLIGWIYYLAFSLVAVPSLAAVGVFGTLSIVSTLASGAIVALFSYSPINRYFDKAEVGDHSSP
ncbi:MAG: hypothetical protein AAFX93_19155 [Verrucomicrobiota bacterium]